MAGRGTVGALLGSGLLAITALGAAGGYGVGLLTEVEGSSTAFGTAAPLGTVKPVTPTPSAPTATPRPVKRDNAPALDPGGLSYKTRSFTVKYVYKSRVTVRVPGDWRMTQPDPPINARFTDPTSKRWIRIEAGFTIRRPPADSMAERIEQLDKLDPSQMLTIISSVTEDNYATLIYSYVPPESQAPEAVLRYVIVRWVADATGNCAVEMGSTGLPQDAKALIDVLDHATSSVVREDSPL
ncbi:hypothetical protein EV646_11553 [Kribbella antiqua]|uniref:Uncharacterized protein n=1 Tax=Kribbella antiqua TaxID=2512217 RepID=A0A4R2IBK4_9ACTN|nr:hypothetical protein [Kribbella antiqua]TCO41512.1 hypothetical protein EV646_11553 [Kribbella antiqua]